MDRWLKVLDASTGNELWKFQVGSGVIGNAFSYHIQGKQYIGIFSGHGGKFVTDAVEFVRKNPWGVDTRMPGTYDRLLINHALVDHYALTGSENKKYRSEKLNNIDGGMLHVFSL